MCLAQGHNPVTQVRFEPAAPQSQVEHSTTEPLKPLNTFSISMSHNVDYPNFIAWNWMEDYCKFENFHENLMCANSVKRHICQIDMLKIRNLDLIYLHQ